MIKRRYSATGRISDTTRAYQLESVRNQQPPRRYELGDRVTYFQYRSPKRKGVILPDGWKLPTAYAQFIAEVTLPGEPTYYYRAPVGALPSLRRWTYYNHSVGTLFKWNQLSDINGHVVKDDGMRSRAGIEATQKLSQGDFNLGVALAESKQTFNFVVDNAIKLANVYRAARRGRWSKAGRILGFKNWTDSKGTSNKWLEYQYGLMPLISDIYGATEVLRDGFKSKNHTLKAVRVIKQSFPSPTRSNFTSSGSCELSVRCSIHARIRNADLATAASLGLTNPALIAWELVPFSFVIDWVLPVGDLLEASSAIHGLDFVSGSYSWQAKLDLDWTSTTLKLQSGEPYQFKEKQFAFERVPITKWPLEAPKYLKNPFSTTKAVTAIALVRQLAGRRQ